MQSSLSTAVCSASSHAMPIDFKSRDTVSNPVQSWPSGFSSGESICHHVACFGILSSSVLRIEEDRNTDEENNK